MRGWVAIALALVGCADAVEGADDWRRLGQGAIEIDAGVDSGDAGAGADALDAPPPGHVVINEVAAAGEPVDWFEVYNIDAVPVDLSAWTFSDDITAPAPGPGGFAPGTVLAPGAFLYVEVSDAATGFKLGGDEGLVLFDGAGRVVSAVDWRDGDSPAGHSLARVPDGIGPFTTVADGSPGEANVF